MSPIKFLGGRVDHLLPLPFLALKASLRDGYTAKDLRADLLAGVSVGIIALPLAMALAVASGVPPQYGLYTSIIGGIVIALLGGSRVSVSGPTAAFVVLLAPISAQYGLGGLVLCTLMAGGAMCLMGAAGLGKLVTFIPHPVTTGFTAGIAVVIATLQLKDFFGLELAQIPDNYFERVIALAVAARNSISWPDAVTGVITLSILVFFPKVTRRIPAPLAGTLGGAIAAQVFMLVYTDAQIATIAGRFTYEIGGQTGQGIPPILPRISLPWNFPGPDGQPIGIHFSLLRKLAGPALAIALLGSIESLLCAVAADGMAGTRHDPDAELLAQGTGNIVCSFFGGFAATGAIARTAANIRAGGRSPIASVAHAIFLLIVLLLLAKLLGYLPMATLAALLIMVAWDMSDMRHFLHILRAAPKSDIAVLLTCFSLTVIFDMVIAVAAGVVLAALLFMRRMAELTHSRPWHEHHELQSVDIPKDVVVYEIAGPLFFGAAEKVFRTLENLDTFKGKRAVILHMHGVPVMDMTGLAALETMLKKFKKGGPMVILSGVNEQPRGVLEKAGITSEPGHIAFVHDLEQAVMVASIS